MELRQFKRTLQQAMILPVIACLFLAGVLIWQIHDSNATVDRIQQADQRIALATKIELLVVDEESGLRGYQTTADPRFLQPYYAAQVPLQQSITLIKSIATGATPQLNAFIAEHEAWRSGFAESLIGTIRAGGRASDVDLNLTGKTTMDSMRQHLNTIVHTSEQRRTDSIADWHRQKRDVLSILVFLALAIGFIIGLFTRDRLEEVSAAFIRSLDLQRSRTEELFQSEQNLRTTLASIGDGVITCDSDGNIQMMNPVAQELTGWIESQAVGHRWSRSSPSSMRPPESRSRIPWPKCAASTES